MAIIIAITLIKYKPMYEVRVSGITVGYTQNIKAFEESIASDVINYTSKNVDSVELTTLPEYQLKLIEKTQSTNENEILIALQKEMDITYKYYQIKQDGKVLDSVDTLEDAEKIEALAKENENIELEIEEIKTNNIEEIKTSELEVAKSNILEIIEEENTIATIQGIKIATLPITGIITSRYAESSSIRSSTHTGLDIAAKKGTNIKVIADGTVTFAEDSNSYGNLVKVNHGNGVETWYAHTDKMYVKPGQKVKAGDIIASVGTTGNTTGPHLHFEIRVNGQHVNPQKYFYN